MVIVFLSFLLYYDSMVGLFMYFLSFILVYFRIAIPLLIYNVCAFIWHIYIYAIYKSGLKDVKLLRRLYTQTHTKRHTHTYNSSASCNVHAYIVYLWVFSRFNVHAKLLIGNTIWQIKLAIEPMFDIWYLKTCLPI